MGIYEIGLKTKVCIVFAVVVAASLIAHDFYVRTWSQKLTLIVPSEIVETISGLDSQQKESFK